MIDLTDGCEIARSNTFWQRFAQPVWRRIETIPYEIITSMSRRVKRLYYFE